jgi:hypothetical protein
MRTFVDTSSSPVGGFETGRWEHFGSGIRLLHKRPTPLRHSGGNAAQDHEVDLRRRVWRIASVFLDGRPWYEVLDFEQGQKASYVFLRPAAEPPCFSDPGPQDPQDELPEQPKRAAQALSTKPVFFDPAVLEVKRARPPPSTRVAAASAAKKVILRVDLLLSLYSYTLPSGGL